VCVEILFLFVYRLRGAVASGVGPTGPVRNHHRSEVAVGLSAVQLL